MVKAIFFATLEPVEIVLMLFCVVAARIGYASIYGELPKLELKKEVSDIPFIPSERPWETIFTGSSHVLPPLTKLCSAFLASLLEKRPVSDE
jgi:NET1-associated nuclear protein 1 (U3 small nucleolar RNA-associated protein 17)